MNHNLFIFPSGIIINGTYYSWFYDYFCFCVVTDVSLALISCIVSLLILEFKNDD